MKKLKMMLIVSMILVSSLQAETIIGKVYGDKTWIAYIGTGGSIFIRRGVTDFASSCNTGFVSKNKYVLSPDGSSYTSKNSVLTAIQTRLVRGKYKNHGCR